MWEEGVFACYNDASMFSQSYKDFRAGFAAGGLCTRGSQCGRVARNCRTASGYPDRGDAARAAHKHAAVASHANAPSKPNRNAPAHVYSSPQRNGYANSRVPATNTPWVNPNNMASLRFQNNTDETIFAILSGRSYGEYSFSDSWNLTTPWGDYNYLVWIGNEGPYGSSFRITNRDKYTLVIDPGKVHMVGP